MTGQIGGDEIDDDGFSSERTFIETITLTLTNPADPHELEFSSLGVSVDSAPHVLWGSSGDAVTTAAFGSHRVEVSGKKATVTFSNGTTFEIVGRKMSANTGGRKPVNLAFDVLSSSGFSPAVNGIVGTDILARKCDDFAPQKNQL